MIRTFAVFVGGGAVALSVASMLKLDTAQLKAACVLLGVVAAILTLAGFRRSR